MHDQFSDISGEKALKSKEQIVWMWPVVVLVGICLITTGLIAFRNFSNNKVSANSDPVVTISSNGLNPATIKVRKHQTVVWVNNDTRPHALQADQSAAEGLDAEDLLDTGDTLNVAFSQPGTYTYHDPTMPNELKGTIIVE